MIKRSLLTSRRAATVFAVGVLACIGLGVGVTQVAADGDTAHRLTHAQRTVLREATRHFRDESAAVAAGYVPTDECVAGMGYHYVRPDLVSDLNIDPTLPEILVYTPTPDGGRKLGAIEWFRADLDQDKATDDDRPTLFGHGFDGPMDPHAAGQPIHYDLHAWLYKHNPDGELHMTNPNVHCPEP